MASINWPSTLAEALISQAPIREPGLAGWWSMNTVPEYPTGTAQWLRTTFTSADIATGTDGPTASKYAWADQSVWDNYNLQVVGGVIQFEKRSGGQGIFRISQDAKNKTRRTKIKPASAATLLFNNDGTVYQRTLQGGVWNLVDVSFDGTGSVITDIEGWPTGINQISLDYIGDGSYAANSLLDNSGNGNHYRIFGSAPTAGISGNGLSRDGTNDFERSELVLASIPDVWHLREVRPSGSTSLAQNQTMFNYGANTGAYLWVYREASTDTLRVAFFNTADTSVAFASFFTGFSATRIDIDVVVDWINRIVKVYRNGVFFGQTTLTNAVKPSAGGYAYWGAYQGTAHFSRSIVDERREYSVDVEASKISSLFASPSSYQALPEYPLQSGYSNTGPEGVLRSSSDSGVDAVRRWWTAVPTYIDAQYQLTSFQRQLLEYFWKTTTKQGTIRFNWPHPEYGPVEARFRGRPSYSAVDTEVAANVSLEVFA